jgi:hypothetical protein
MRPYQSCVFARFLCVVFSVSKYCEQYIRRDCICELASLDREIIRLDRK